MSGRRYERKLVSELSDAGWAFVKSPSSGSGRAEDQPDLVVGKATTGLPPLAIEAKTSRDGALTVPEPQAAALQRWAGTFGAAPLLAVYWVGPQGGNVSYGGWWFRPLTEVRRSPAENDAGGHHLRPRREDRGSWVQLADLEEGRLYPPAGEAGGEGVSAE
jgi:Holliday junction resolvase